MKGNRKGFTIAEVVIGVMVFAAVVVVGITLMNPSGQLKLGRNSERNSHINSILNAVRQNIADNRSGFSCAAGLLPTTTKRMASGAGTSTYNIAPCLVPVYMDRLPYDPGTTTAYFTGVADYNSGYSILQSTSTGQITVSAPYAEAGKVISVTR